MLEGQGLERLPRQCHKKYQTRHPHGVCLLISLIFEWLWRCPCIVLGATAAEFQDIKSKPLPLVATRSMDMKDPFHVSSSYMLLEATGDSEADCNPTLGEQAYEIGREDDDAQSCSYDISETCNAAEFNGYESLNIDDDDEGEKSAQVHGISYCEDDEMQQHQKSCVSDDSSQELVDEMEKNRLWGGTAQGCSRLNGQEVLDSNFSCKYAACSSENLFVFSSKRFKKHSTISLTDAPPSPSSSLP
ncbi:hypothetical protein CR513_38734, partial [Mucuna pruriens]